MLIAREVESISQKTGTVLEKLFSAVIRKQGQTIIEYAIKTNLALFLSKLSEFYPHLLN